MRLTRYEQETTVNFNAEEPRATIYTADPVWMRKLRKLAEKNSIDFKLEEQATHDGKVIAETYSFPKKFITIRSKAIHQNLTEEQKQAAVERMRKGRGHDNLPNS